MHDRQSSSPRKPQNLSGGANSFGDCIEMNALYLAKSAWFNEAVIHWVTHVNYSAAQLVFKLDRAPGNHVSSSSRNNLH
jgi:hypothetical protein